MQKILQALLKWSPSSAGAAITLHMLWQNQWTQGAIAFTGTALVSLLTAYSDKFTAILKQAVEQRGEQDARWVVGQVGGMGFGDRYRQSLIYSYRTTRTQGFDLAPFKPDLEQVYVPLRVQASSLPQLSPAMIQPERSIDALSIWPFLVNAPAARIALIGPPGSGKSTLLEHLALTYARKSHRQQHPKAPDRLPILLYLRDWRDAIAAESPPTLVQLIEQQVQKQPSDRPLEKAADWFATRLAQGECLVMLDGLDEVADPTQRQKVAQWVNQQMQRYGRSPFILTSRPFGYDSVKIHLPQIDLVLGVQPFHWREVEQFIVRWYRENESKRQARSIDPGVEQAARRSAADLLHRIQNSPPLAAMAVNPLLLTMIATVHCYRGALPGRRVELYAEICDVLLGRRQEAKGLGDRLSAAQKQIVLQVLALKGMQRNTREFKLVTACLLIRQRLATVAGAEADPIEFLQSIERVSGLLVQREQDVYEFAHKSLQEYLAAKQIKEINQEMLLARHMDDPWWEETIRLFAAQSDASYLIQTAIDRNTVQSLAIAYDCLEEGLRVDPNVRKSLEVAIEKGLESTNLEIFQLAVEVKLSRRLKNLLRIDDKTEIDLSYITCAEYQLFIDQKRSIGQNRQPDHWTSDRFLPGDANKPIAGVRASDAIEFCDWLTARSSVLGDVYEEGGDRVYVGEFKYRIPTLEETQGHKIHEAQFNCWYQDENRQYVAEIESTQLQIWKQQLPRNLTSIFERSLAFIDLVQPYGITGISVDYGGKTHVVDIALARKFVALYMTHLAQNFNYSITPPSSLNIGRDSNLGLVYHSPSNRNNSQYGKIVISEFETARNRVADRMEEENDIQLVCIHVFLYISAWNLILEKQKKANEKTLFKKILRLVRKTSKEDAKFNYECEVKRNSATSFYVFLALLKERRSQRLPAWEGIRIVREKFSK